MEDILFDRQRFTLYRMHIAISVAYLVSYRPICPRTLQELYDAINMNLYMILDINNASAMQGTAINIANTYLVNFPNVVSL